MKKNKMISLKKFTNKEVVFLVVVTCVVSVMMGYIIGLTKEKTIKKDAVLEEISNTYYDIIESYYKEVDKTELLSGAVNGMLSVLDQHSILIDEEDENFNLNLDGSYKGIGIEIINDSNNNIYIYGILENSPAAKAGLQSGDIVKKVDDIDMTNKDISELSTYVRKNDSKQQYTIVVDRNGEELQFTIKKEEVIIKSVASKVIEKDNYKIGYIYISIFSNTTATQFIEQLDKLEKEGINSLILDVRENTGGHLSAVSRMLSYMLSSDKIVYQINKSNKITKYYSMGNKNKEYKIAIIQNGNSASASELLSISLKENLGAIIVGKNSYGKGTVQELTTLSNGDSYKYTTKLWLSPNGNSIDGVGVTPDIEVVLNEEYYENPSDDTDNQLQTAINALIK